MTVPQATLMLCGLLQVLLVSGHVVVDPEPEFLAPLENHTVSQGRDVYFTCVVNHLGQYKVAWIKSDSKAILAIHTHMVAQNPRISVTHNGHNTWKLHISNVQRNDSGTYMCQINTDPMRSQMGTLEIVIPPEILNDNESSSGMAVEGGTVRLHCHAIGVPTPEVWWKREDTQDIVFRHEGGKQVSVQTFGNETLILSNIQRSDMGAYLCIAQNGVPPMRSKRYMVEVHFHPRVQVKNQLVAAPVTRTVMVQCIVEASPKAMNHWVKESGEKLMPNHKYSIGEMVLNPYTVLMNLTIRSLEKGDFGGYICKSSNALGKAEGTVRLQELDLPMNSTSTASTPKYIDVKPHKKMNKDKPPKKLKKERIPIGAAQGEEEFTTVALPEVKTYLPPSKPNSSKPPRVVRSGAVTQKDKFALCLFILFVLRRL